MTGPSLRALTAATGLALAACASSSPSAREPTMPTSANTMPPSRSMPVKRWPLKFKNHSFGAYCYDTRACTIHYANFEHGSEEPSTPSATYGPGYLDHLDGGHIGIRNFPAPAKVGWVSKDGQAHTAEIDMGELFANEVIRHNVKRDEMSDVVDGEYRDEPAILLEVNDRTIRVYMRAHIPTKALQKPGNRYSDFRNDLMLVKTYTF